MNFLSGAYWSVGAGGIGDLGVGALCLAVLCHGLVGGI